MTLATTSGAWRLQRLETLTGRRALVGPPQRWTLALIGLVTCFATQDGIPAVTGAPLRR